MGVLIPLKQSGTLMRFPRGAQSARGLITSALRRHRLPESLITALVHDAEAWPQHPAADVLAWALARRMRRLPIDFEKARGILLVGPADAGKSAVAAKIAHHALLMGRQVEMAGAADGMALFRTATFDSNSLLVMEAPGFNPVNRRALSAFAALGEAEGVESFGVVSAASDAEDAAEIVGALRPPRIIVTGLDRTTRMGATVAAITAGARLAHVTYGPRADDPLESLAPDALARLLLD